MSEKTIKINPDLFSLSGKRSSAKNKKKKPANPQKSSTLKQQLLKRINEHNKRNKSTIVANKSLKSDGDTNKQDTDFDKAIDDLTKISQDYKKKNKTLRRNNPVSETIATQYNDTSMLPVNVELPSEFDTTIDLKPRTSPPYGCLKNGQKPTYRVWKARTMKNDSSLLPTPSEPTSTQIVPSNLSTPTPILEQSDMPAPILEKPATPPPILEKPATSAPILEKPAVKISTDESLIPISPASKISRRYHRMKKAREEFEAIEKSTLTSSENDITPKKILRKKTTTRKYNLGKIGRKIGVLIKNRDTRKKIQYEKSLMKDKSIKEVKNYLRDHSLLKIGSGAPNEVVRQIYEQSLLSGDIQNNSGEVLVHNYMSDEAV